MPEEKSSRSNANLGGPYHPIDLKKALKTLQEKPQEEFDRLRKFIETHDDLPSLCDPED